VADASARSIAECSLLFLRGEEGFSPSSSQFSSFQKNFFQWVVFEGKFSEPFPKVFVTRPLKSRRNHLPANKC